MCSVEGGKSRTAGPAAESEHIFTLMLLRVSQGFITSRVVLEKYGQKFKQRSREGEGGVVEGSALKIDY